MNLLAQSSPARTAPDAANELAREVFEQQQLEAAATFKALLAMLRLGVSVISGEMGYVPGWDKDAILDVLSDWGSFTEKDVKDWAADNYGGDGS